MAINLRWEAAALERRLEYVASLKQSLERPDSVAAQAVAAYSDLIDDLVREVSLEVHRAVKTGADDLADVRARHAAEAEREAESPEPGARGKAAAAAAPPPPPPPLTGALGAQVAGGKGGVDVFGNHVPPIALDQVRCPSCGRAVAAGRFAPHLDKCMGTGGRGRAAARRP